jgi:hypothetical protein
LLNVCSADRKGQVFVIKQSDFRFAKQSSEHNQSAKPDNQAQGQNLLGSNHLLLLS